MRYREILKALNYNPDTNKWQVKQGIEIDSANTGGLKLQDRFRMNNEAALSKTANKRSSKGEKAETRQQSNRSESKTSAFRKTFLKS